MSNSYVFPKIDLLSQEYDIQQNKDHNDNARKIEEFFRKRDISVTVTDEFEGPLVTEYAITIKEGTHVHRITELQQELMSYLGYQYLNIEYPVMGEPKIGINVPSDNRYIMPLRKVLEDNRYFAQSKKNASFLIGRNMQNQLLMGDLAG